ncbi:MAG: arylsulfatase [Planctomycetota bacterium]
MADKRPNIMLVFVDQWRADALSGSGHPVVETPHLDWLFREGARFDQAYAAVPSCIASRAALMTGLNQRHHGRVGYQDHVPWNYTTTLAGELTKAGFHTQCVGKMHVSPTRELMGFHNVVLHDGYLHANRCSERDYNLNDDYLMWLRGRHGPQADYIDAGPGCNGYSVHPWPYDEMSHPTSWVTTQAVDFLRRRDPRKPFFLKVSYHRPHPPLDPPQSYLDIYHDKKLPPVPIGDWAGGPVTGRHGLDSPKPFDPTSIERARKAYYAHLSHIDNQVNRLVHALYENDRIIDNTLIMFTSDHGEMLFDHNRTGKSMPYDCSARVPMLMKFPAHWKGYAARHIDAPVELRDVMPTFLEAAGVSAPESLDGASLLPLCRGENATWREYIHGEHSVGQDSNHWITNGKEMYVWYSQSGEEQYFDLNNDPSNLKNLVREKSDRVTYLRAKLVEELDGREECYVKRKKLVAGRMPQSILKEAGLTA